MPTVLTDAQVGTFQITGCVTLPNAVSQSQLTALTTALDGWIEESRAHAGPFGETLDGRPRFNVQPGHSSDSPALRRVQSPTELSPAYLDVLTNSAMIEMLADLIGPDLRFHHSKVNCKLPGSATVVDWHQDFLFDPHSNDDLVTCLLFLGDVSSENGPLLTVPKSHTGPLHPLWHKETFTGAVAPDVAKRCAAEAVEHTGPAGSVCFMHGRTLHAPRANQRVLRPNVSSAARAAGEAVPRAGNQVPSIPAGMLLRGHEPNRVRAIPFDMSLPEVPETTFFAQQAQASA